MRIDLDVFSNVSKGDFGIHGEDWMRKRRFSATIVCGAVVLVLLAAVVCVVVSCGHRQPARMPPVPMDTLLPDTIRVKSVVRKDVVHSPVVVSPTSRAVAVVCGDEPTTADRYEASSAP